MILRAERKETPILGGFAPPRFDLLRVAVNPPRLSGISVHPRLISVVSGTGPSRRRGARGIDHKRAVALAGYSISSAADAPCSKPRGGAASRNSGPGNSPGAASSVSSTFAASAHD